MDKNNLKPCPFCGGKAIIRQTVFDSICVNCTVCGVSSPFIEANTNYCAYDKVVEIWNKRVEETTAR